MAKHLFPTNRLENGEGGQRGDIENYDQCMGAMEGAKKSSPSCGSPSKSNQNERKGGRDGRGMENYGGVMVPCRQVQIYLSFLNDNFFFLSQDHVPLCHMILTLFPDYSDCIVVPAALYSSYVFPLVSCFVPPCMSFGSCCTYSLFTVSHGLGLAVYKSVGLRNLFPKLLA